MEKKKDIVDGIITLFRKTFTGKRLSIKAEEGIPETDAKPGDTVMINFDSFIEKYEYYKGFHDNYEEFIKWYTVFSGPGQLKSFMQLYYSTSDKPGPDNPVTKNEDGTVSLRIKEPQIIEFLTTAKHPHAMQVTFCEKDYDAMMEDMKTRKSEDGFVEILEETAETAPLWQLYLNNGEEDIDDIQMRAWSVDSAISKGETMLLGSQRWKDGFPEGYRVVCDPVPIEE